MKVNMPVTGVERDYSEDDVILSTTNTKGQITYVNDDFIEVSGFELSELRNQSHNIVRHPDMPPAAFEDLWSTIKANKSWMGIVKNRCKNGDHYWVNAYVTPITRDGKIVEYQSVRTKPDGEDVRRAEALYSRLNAGKKAAKTKLFEKLGIYQKSLLTFVASLLPWLLTVAVMGKIDGYTVVAVAVVSMLIAAAGLRWSLGNIIKSVKCATRIVDNPLLQKVYTGMSDEGGQLLLAIKMLQTEIGAISGRLLDSSKNLKHTATELSSSVALTGQGVSHQDEQTKNLIAAMQEMKMTAENVATSAQSASDAANEASQNAVNGQQVVNETVTSIKALAQQVESSSGIIRRLGKDSEDIGSILDVIKTIAEQTNLLALNAAIEAARAGEQGRGFAVVADEVRSLATRTHESTKEIEEMILRLQEGSREAVVTMDGGCKKANDTVESVSKAGEALQEITTAVTKINDMNAQISSAADEQTATVNTINNNVEAISEVSELTVETLEGSNNISNDLDKTSNLLYELSSHFFHHIR